MKLYFSRLCFSIFIVLGVSACSTVKHTTHDALPLSYASRLPAPDKSVLIPNLRNCTFSDNENITFNSQEPVTIIVHGCFSSAGKFRSLADVYAYHGQQSFCFNYNDRDSLEQSSAELITALTQLSKHLASPMINIIGHSQGGLVSRRALIQEREDQTLPSHLSIQLTTISTPFGGIEASAHCNSTTAKWLSLGLVHPICMLITGAKYSEIPPNSAFINQPGTLLPMVTRHTKIVTDESNTCRKIDTTGKCLEDDFVFSIPEQYQKKVDNLAIVHDIRIKAGHVEIVGDEQKAPHKLITILQDEDLLKALHLDSTDYVATYIDNIYK